MKKLVLGVLLVGLLVACSEEKKKVTVVAVDAKMMCSVLTNSGCAPTEKCTWLVDALMPNYIGRIGCAPEGAVPLGGTCMYGAAGEETGYDDCVKGTVCSTFRNNSPGICKQICDQQGGMPACDTNHVCVIYSQLFDLGETTPAAAGVCNVACDPLTDNDFDGKGAIFERTGTKCSAPNEGCYGRPSGGTPPVSGFSCTRDINYDGTTFFGHRHKCDVASGCADMKTGRPYQNSCNQGYLPVLRETTGSTTTICVAFCEPANCFMGNCGTDNTNRLGKADSGNQCNATDRIGSFDGTLNANDNGEHCQYLWRSEIDFATSTYLPSQYSDKLGFCLDHSKYMYDSDGDMIGDTVYPACAQLADGFGPGGMPTMPTLHFGAADFGCVDSTRLMTATGKSQVPAAAIKTMQKLDMPRPLFDNRVYEQYE